jgi:beta-lactamase regulating signal transducer with metallopeptidase domain
MKIIHLSGSEFDDVIEGLKKMGVECPEENNFAFTVTTGISSSGVLIVYNKDCGLDNDEKQIVIHHERAHLQGIMNEEEADRFALKYLNRKQRKMLKENWNGRHGHSYVC